MLFTNIKAKSGIIVGEYGSDNEYLGWIEPAVKNSSWIMWFKENGDAVLYTDRDKDGSVLGIGLEIKGKSDN